MEGKASVVVSMWSMLALKSGSGSPTSASSFEREECDGRSSISKAAIRGREKGAREKELKGGKGEKGGVEVSVNKRRHRPGKSNKNG